MAGTISQVRDLSARERRRLVRERFSKAQGVEKEFQRALDSVVDRIRKVLKQDISPEELTRKLKAYSKKLGPWARETVQKMHQQVLKRDEQSWAELAEEIGLPGVRRRIAKAPVRPVLRDLLREQVGLIKSIPAEAAQRVHDLTLRGLVEGMRASTTRDEILKGVDISASKVQLICRTEVARTASLLTETRAKSIGSEGYIWRTSLDTDVRPQHKKLEGRFIRWSSPPIAGTNGMRYHAGQGPN